MLDKRIFGEVPEEVHQRLLDTLDALEEKKRRSFKLPKVAIIIGACFLISGITVSASVVQNMYRQHMESMNRQKMEEYYAVAMLNDTSFCLSRELTTEEKTRLRIIRKSFKARNEYPQDQIMYLEAPEDYKGKGLGLDTQNGVLYIPEKVLSDDEILQIVDLENKISYSIYALNQERILNGDDWMSRMAKMTDEEVDEIFRIYFMGAVHVSGDFSRVLSDKENKRYRELIRQYEEEGLYTANEVSIIEAEGDYTGCGIAFAKANSTFYLPEQELSDDEMLQIIDFEHRSIYCLNRINEEIAMGLRQGQPEFE